NLDTVATVVGGVALAAFARYGGILAKGAQQYVALNVQAVQNSRYTLAVATSNLRAAESALTLARANQAAFASQGQRAARNYANALVQYSAAAENAVTWGRRLSGIGSTLLTFFGGLPGLVIAGGAALAYL